MEKSLVKWVPDPNLWIQRGEMIVFRHVQHHKHQSKLLQIPESRLINQTYYKWSVTRKMFPFDDVIMYSYDSNPVEMTFSVTLPLAYK